MECVLSLKKKKRIYNIVPAIWMFLASVSSSIKLMSWYLDVSEVTSSSKTRFYYLVVAHKTIIFLLK